MWLLPIHACWLAKRIYNCWPRTKSSGNLGDLFCLLLIFSRSLTITVGLSSRPLFFIFMLWEEWHLFKKSLNKALLYVLFFGVVWLWVGLFGILEVQMSISDLLCVIGTGIFTKQIQFPLFLFRFFSSSMLLIFTAMRWEFCVN